MRLDAITTAESVADFCKLHCQSPRQQNVADHRQVATWQQSQQQQGWSITGQRSQCSSQVYGKQLSDYGHKSIKRLKDLYIALVERSCRWLPVTASEAPMEPNEAIT